MGVNQSVEFSVKLLKEWKSTFHYLIGIHNFSHSVDHKFTILNLVKTNHKTYYIPVSELKLNNWNNMFTR